MDKSGESATPRWRIELFGGLRLIRGEQTITRFHTRQTGALLAYLAFHCERPHPRDWLMEMLWPDADSQAGRHNLSMALSFLRGLLEPPDVPSGTVILADRHTVQLNPQRVSTDVAEFTAALQQAEHAADGPERILHFTRALELYRGELLRGYYQDWILPHAVRLEELYTRDVHRLMCLLEQEGDHEKALDVAAQALAHIPLHEEIHLEIMRLYVALGKSENALRQYEHLKRLLADQLGTEPSGNARELAEQIRQQDRAPQTPSAWLEPGNLKASELEAALDWTFAHAPERALLLVLSLTPFWEQQAHWQQGALWIERALSQPHLDPTTQATLLSQAGRFAFRLGAYEQADHCYIEAHRLFQKTGNKQNIADLIYQRGRVAHYRCTYARAITLYHQALAKMQEIDDQRGMVTVLSSVGHVLSLQGHYERAGEALQEGLKLAREIRDREREAILTHNCAFLALLQARLKEAHTLYDQALEIRRSLQDQLGIAALLNGLGRTMLALGDAEKAIALCSESIAVRRVIGDRPGMAHASCFLARAHLEQGQWENAQALFEQSLAICREFGNRTYEAMCLEGLALLAFRRDQHEDAARLLQEASTLRKTIGTPLPPLDQPAIKPVMEALDTQP